MTDQPTKALTVHDPWADAIIHGDKWIENRTWKPYSGSLGNRLLIHTAKAWDSDHAERADGLRYMGLHEYDDERAARGHIIGSVRVVGWVRDTPTESEFEFDCGWTREPTRYRNSAIVSPWWHGPIGWILDDAIAYDTPVAARGQQRIWTPNDDALKRCRAQEERHADIQR